MNFYSKPMHVRAVGPQEPIPVGEVQELDWAEWADSVGYQDSQPMDFQRTDKLPLTPLDSDSADAFASVTRKSK